MIIFTIFAKIFYNMITRSLQSVINEKLNKGKAIIVLGPRQTGKTTLLKLIAKEADQDFLYINCDDFVERSKLENANTEGIAQILGAYKLVIIDEAQRVKDIGLCLKLITDRFLDVQLLASGSSSLDLASEINEPLTGRKWEYMLYPVSWKEFEASAGLLNAEKQFETRLIYGMYPDVINNVGNEKEVLQSLASSYLYKDLLAIEGIRKPELIEKLLMALAWQLGNEVSYNELSNLLGFDKNTISKYINLLKKAFIIFELSSLSRNHRKEINSGRKIYFFDNGIRNSIINNFNPLSSRNDNGALWENFCISERIKHTHYNKIFCNRYFWRTKDQQEIDYIEEKNGIFTALEFKWSYKANWKPSSTFIASYPDYESRLVTPQNFRSALFE